MAGPRRWSPHEIQRAAQLGQPKRLIGRPIGPPRPGTQPALPELQAEFRRYVRERTAMYAERYWVKHLGPETGRLMAASELEALFPEIW